MALIPVPPQVVNLAVSCAPKTEQDLLLPIAKVSTSSNAHAVVRLFTSGKPLDPYAKDAKNTKKRLKKAIGPTQESPLIKNIAKSLLTGKIPLFWPLLVGRIKNVWPMMPKSARLLKYDVTTAVQDRDLTKIWEPMSRLLNGTLSSTKWQ